MIDVLVVSVGSTGGWRAADRELADAMARAGATVELVSTPPPPRVRTFALTDLVQARLARQAAQRGIAEHEPRAVVYCSVTASLLWPRPGAIFLDSVAAENRPGRHGVWQRPVERRRLREAPLLLTWSERALEPVRDWHADAFVVSPPVAVPPAATGGMRDVAAVTYAGNPVKRRLGLVLEAWAAARRDGEQLVVAGTDTITPSAGVEVAGTLAPDDFHALLSRARLFLAAPEREDFGIAALEALAHGCRLVTTPAPGPYPALALARELDPRLVSDDLPAAIRTALDAPRPGYVARAAELLTPFRREAADRTIANQVLPRLLPGWTAG
ncbi:MAG TPA: glycosyltransferase [Solirubrobacteraceae bacterium]